MDQREFRCRCHMSPQMEAQTTRERGFLTGGRRIVDADAVCLKALHGLLTVEDLAHYLDVPVATVYAWRYRRQTMGRFARPSCDQKAP